MSFKVIKHTQLEDGVKVEDVATFDNAERAADYALTLSTMEKEKSGGKIWFTAVPIQSDTAVRWVQPYRLTQRPLKDGFMNILKDMRHIFPARSGKIFANLEGFTEKQLTFDAKNNRIFGLSEWYRKRGARIGDYVSVMSIKPFEYYLFQIIKPSQTIGNFDQETVESKSPTSSVPLSGAIFRDQMFLPHRFEGTGGEAKLEDAVIKNYRKSLGEGTFYIPVKKLVGTEIKKVTDGLLLDLNDPKHTTFWIVEVELSSHDLENHVQKQLMGFLTALEEEKTKRDLLKAVWPYVDKNSDDAWNVKYFVPLWDGKTTPYQLIDNLIHSEPGILVIIDEVTPKLQAMMSLLSKLGPVKIVEFKTFGKGGEFVHYFSHVADLKKR